MSWVENEMKASRLGDKRLDRRLSLILDDFSENPEESIPSVCHGWAETQAAYRFIDNDKVNAGQILQGHHIASVERIQTQQCVLIPQDTTFLNVAREESVGLGTLRRTQSEQYLVHATVAFTPSRVNLGVVNAKFWQRPDEPVAHLRNKKPIEEKESYRWLESYEIACQIQRQCPDTLIISIADREGDIHEWFADVENREPEERAEFIVRAKCNRCTEQEPGEYSYLWDELSEAPVLRQLRIKTPRSGDKPSRSATLEVRVKEVELCGRQGKTVQPVTVYAVYAKEKKPPKGEVAIEWMLLTSLPVEDKQSAEIIIAWYRCRWEIELYFRVFKQGCRVERLRLETDKRLFNALAIYMIIAWRIHTITMLSRAHGSASCEMLFSDKEWKTIYMMQQKSKPPTQPPSLNEITRMLAQLGGFLARKGDGEPGVKNIWRGYRALHNYVDALEVAEVAL